MRSFDPGCGREGEGPPRYCPALTCITTWRIHQPLSGAIQTTPCFSCATQGHLSVHCTLRFTAAGIPPTSWCAREKVERRRSLWRHRAVSPLTGPVGKPPCRHAASFRSILTTRAITTLASGAFHRPGPSGDRRTLTLRRENPLLSDAPARTFFHPEAQGDAAYDAVNWGTEIVHLDPRTGAAMPAATAVAMAADPNRPALRARAGTRGHAPGPRPSGAT